MQDIFMKTCDDRRAKIKGSCFVVLFFTIKEKGIPNPISDFLWLSCLHGDVQLDSCWQNQLQKNHTVKERRPRTRRWLKPEQKTIMSPICWCLMLNIFFFPIHFAFSSREESKDRRLSSPYHRHSYHLMQTDSQDAGAEQR